MMDPPIEALLDRVDSKYTLVSLAAKRGREVNSYFNQLGEGLGSIVPPQVTSISRKPLSIALDEVSAGKITYHRVEEVVEDQARMVPPAACSALRTNRLVLNDLFDAVVCDLASRHLVQGYGERLA